MVAERLEAVACGVRVVQNGDSVAVPRQHVRWGVGALRCAEQYGQKLELGVVRVYVPRAGAGRSHGVDILRCC